MDEIRFVAGPIVQRYLDKQEAERQAVLKAREEENAKRRAELEAKKEAEKKKEEKEGGKKEDEEMKDAPPVDPAAEDGEEPK